MKLSPKSFLMALALGVAIVPSFSIAQDGPPPRPPGGGGGPGGGGRGRMNPEQRVQRLDEALTLTAEQKTKITEIYKKQGEAIQALPQEERRGEKGMELMKATHTEVRAVLTPEQQVKFDAMPQRGPGGGGQRGGGSGGPGGEKPMGKPKQD